MNTKLRFDICNELRDFERFVREILKLRNDNEMQKILKTAWENFYREQLKHPDEVLSGWRLVETMTFKNDEVSIGLM